MYKLIIIDACAPSSQGLITVNNIMSLLSDDVLSVSERERMHPYICFNCNDARAFKAAEMRENGID